MTRDEPPDAAYRQLSTTGLLDLRLAFVQVQRMAVLLKADPTIDAYCVMQRELIDAVLRERTEHSHA